MPMLSSHRVQMEGLLTAGCHVDGGAVATSTDDGRRIRPSDRAEMLLGGLLQSCYGARGGCRTIAKRALNKNPRSAFGSKVAESVAKVCKSIACPGPIQAAGSGRKRTTTGAATE